MASQSAVGTVRAAGGGADGVNGHGEVGDSVGAGGGPAHQAVSHQRGHERHPERASCVQVSPLVNLRFVSQQARVFFLLVFVVLWCVEGEVWKEHQDTVRGVIA